MAFKPSEKGAPQNEKNSAAPDRKLRLETFFNEEVGDILRMLCSCDKRSLELIKVTIRALIDTAPKG